METTNNDHILNNSNNQKLTSIGQMDLNITMHEENNDLGNIIFSFGNSRFDLNKSLREVLLKFIDDLTSNQAYESFIKPYVTKQIPVSPATLQPKEMTNGSFQMMVCLQPQSLFLLSLIKLNHIAQIVVSFGQLTERNIPIILKQLALKAGNPEKKDELAEISAPDSLTSAPPSYTFVLRQISARRRPRLMGTFIPSPSFVQHVPPPHYGQAFDIYIDNPLPAPPRAYTFGFHPMLIVCPECGFSGTTHTTAKITFCTHICALMLCFCCCWLCVPLPYLLKSCKDVYHYCGNCRTFLGIYRPTNSEAV